MQPYPNFLNFLSPNLLEIPFDQADSHKNKDLLESLLTKNLSLAYTEELMN